MPTPAKQRQEALANILIFQARRTRLLRRRQRRRPTIRQAIRLRRLRCHRWLRDPLPRQLHGARTALQDPDGQIRAAVTHQGRHGRLVEQVRRRHG